MALPHIYHTPSNETPCAVVLQRICAPYGAKLLIS